MVRPYPERLALEYEVHYSELADELNDGSPDQLKLEDFNPSMVRAAEAFAKANEISWPPSTGDFDRYYEWHHTGRYPFD